MFVSLEFVVSNNCKLIRPYCKHLSTETIRLQLRLFLFKNGIISLFNSIDANLKKTIFLHSQAVLTDKIFKNAVGKRVSKTICIAKNYHVA